MIIATPHTAFELEQLLLVLDGKWDSERFGYWPAVDAMAEAAEVIRWLLAGGKPR